MEPLKGKKIARVATVPFFIATQAARQVTHIVQAGADVTLITSDGPELDRISYGPRLKSILVDIPRSLHPWRDAVALVRLTRIFRRERFDIVHSTTPKAGLLCAIAGTFAGVRVRLHTFTGQTWVTLHGPMRWIARWADKMIGILCTRCYADSQSQLDFLVGEHVVRQDKIEVLGIGSLAGIELSRFDPVRFSPEEREDVRRELGIAKTAKIITFVGRLCRDKGLFELLDAFEALHRKGYDADLLLVGPLDTGSGHDSDELSARIKSIPRVHHVGYVAQPERFVAASYLMCLPSYREGFGTVVLEAASLAVPTIGSRIYGLSDAIVHGETGILIPVRDARALEQAMAKLMDTPALREQMAQSARQRCVRDFSDETISDALISEYLRRLANSSSTD